MLGRCRTNPVLFCFKVKKMAVVSEKTPPASVSRRTMTLQDFYIPKPSQAPIRVRPPPPASVDLKHGLPTDPPTKTIVRRRTLSLPSHPRKKEPRKVRVRFVDALGLELERVRFFDAQQNPSVPQHVRFRLLMHSELVRKDFTELNLPYFKPGFPENLSTQPGFVEQLRSQSVSLEKVCCSEHGITGTVQVLNLAYGKQVYVRHSFTKWRTQTDTDACWVASVPGGNVDIFRFHLPVPPFVLLPGTLLEFAICYRVNGSDHWDNNDRNNYTLSCYSYTLTVPKECEGSMLHFT